MQSLGFDGENPTIYQLIADLDTPEGERNGGKSFNDFVDAINDKLGDKESKEEYLIYLLMVQIRRPSL